MVSAGEHGLGRPGGWCDVSMITGLRRRWAVQGLCLPVVGAIVAVTASLLMATAGLARGGPVAASPSVRLEAVAAKGTRRCAAFTVKRVRHGKVVRRHGKVLYEKRTVCVTVTAAKCKVTWIKERTRGRIVLRQHNPVWKAKVSCPRSGTGSPAHPPTPQPPAAGPGNAAVAVYAVTAQGVTFIDNDPTESLPAQSGVPIESFTQHGYLVHLLTPFPGLNGPAQDEIGLFLGSLIGFSENAGTTQFGTNTMMFTAANAGDPTIFQQLPFPYDIGQAGIQGDKLAGYADLRRSSRPPLRGVWPRTTSSTARGSCRARSRA